MLKINNNIIQRGDKVSRLKRGVFFIRHYAVYLGKDNYNRHIFAENNVHYGVQIISAEDFFREAESIRVESFSKTQEQRQRAVAFALKLVREKKSYNLLFYNCEHFANEVATGNAKSNQVKWGLGFAALLVIGNAITGNTKR